MADACNAVQRNLYPKRDGTRFIKDYRNGDGRAYGDYMRQVSWPIPTDVPPIGQASALRSMLGLDGAPAAPPAGVGSLFPSDARGVVVPT